MEHPRPGPAANDDGGGPPSWWRSALAGLVAAASALAVGELVAGASSQLAAPVLSVGNEVVDAAPRPVKDFAIDTFGTNDKVALLAGIYLSAALFGLAVGLVAARRFWVGAGGIAAFGLVGIWAAGQEVGAPWWAGAPSLVGAAAGVGVLATLLSTVAGADHPTMPVAGTGHDAMFARRSFLKATAATVAVAGAAAAGGRWLQSRFSAAGSRLAVVLPRPTRAAPPLSPEVAVDADGVSPFITSNADFYRIDINLTVPQLTAEDWTLKVTGMVDREVVLDFDELLAMDTIEERITMTCVSNEVGGDLVGTATWLGVPLRDLLDRAGVQEGADQVVGRAFDGFTTGFPTDVVADGRPAMVAVGMNGEPLPLAHGFPARLVVPGLYGFVSATKWLTEIELTTFADFDQYWVERDWAADGDIKTMSRIDTPRGLQRVPAGPVAVGGVAWAQTRGIERVEVRLDDGDWVQATLADEDSTVTWRQWAHTFDASPGRHQVTCRATDGTGTVQTDQRAEPFPDGASGWHSVAFLVD